MGLVTIPKRGTLWIMNRETRQTKRLLLLLISLIALAMMTACTSESTPSSPEPPDDERVPSEPTATPTPSPNFRYITIPTEDGEFLAASFYPPQADAAPGILLLHMEDGRKEDWAGFATQLREIGYGPMTLDLRGHGESTGEIDWSSMPADVLLAWNALTSQPEVDPTTSVIVGAGAGADLALAAAAAEPGVYALILLSPGIDGFELQTEEAMVAYGERPVLIITSEDDSYSAEGALTLAELAQGPQVLSVYSQAGRGTDMFTQQPDLASLIQGWLRSQLGSASPD